MSQFIAPRNQLVFTLPHIQLSGRLWGEPDKPLLLALHGWLDNANSFEPLAGYLTDYQLLAIDWPGHGFSGHRADNVPLHWVDYLFDLDALLSVLPRQPLAIIGHSLGGIIAAAYSAAYPEKVRQLVLIEALSPLFEAPHYAKTRLRRSLEQHKRYVEQQYTSAKVYPSLEQAVRARVALTGLDPDWCRLLLSRNMCEVHSGVTWRSDPRLKLDSPYRLCFEQVDALMQDIAVKTLLIYADQGFTQLQQALPQAHKWFTNLSVQMVVGDHHVHMSHAVTVAQRMRSFI